MAPESAPAPSFGAAAIMAIVSALAAGALQVVFFVWWARGKLDNLVTQREYREMKHRVANMAVVVEVLAEERPELRRRVDLMIAPGTGGEKSEPER